MNISSEDDFLEKGLSLSQSLSPDSSFLMEEAPSASKEWLLKFDIVAESAYLPGTSNDIFDLNLRMRLGAPCLARQAIKTLGWTNNRE